MYGCSSAELGVIVSGTGTIIVVIFIQEPIFLVFISQAI